MDDYMIERALPWVLGLRMAYPTNDGWGLLNVDEWEDFHDKVEVIISAKWDTNIPPVSVTMSKNGGLMDAQGLSIMRPLYTGHDGIKLIDSLVEYFHNYE